MTEQIGARIKEARLAAGMSQKALAEAVDGISASSISRAERGLKELSDEQLAAIAEATGAESLLGETEKKAPEAAAEEPEAPEVAAEEPEAPVVDEEDAPPTSKGKKQQAPSPIEAMVGMVGKVVVSETSKVNPLAAMMVDKGIDPIAAAAMMDMMGKIMEGEVSKGKANPFAAIMGGKGIDPSAAAAMMDMLSKVVADGVDKRNKANPLAAMMGEQGIDPSVATAMMDVLGKMMGDKSGANLAAADSVEGK